MVLHPFAFFSNTVRQIDDSMVGKAKATSSAPSKANPYMAFCSAYRSSAAWKKNKYNLLTLPEQGKLLGRLYRQQQQRLVQSHSGRYRAATNDDGQPAFEDTGAKTYCSWEKSLENSDNITVRTVVSVLNGKIDGLKVKDMGGRDQDLIKKKGIDAITDSEGNPKYTDQQAIVLTGGTNQERIANVAWMQKQYPTYHFYAIDIEDEGRLTWELCEQFVKENPALNGTSLLMVAIGNTDGHIRVLNSDGNAIASQSFENVRDDALQSARFLKFIENIVQQLAHSSTSVNIPVNVLFAGKSIYQWDLAKMQKEGKTGIQLVEMDSRTKPFPLETNVLKFLEQQKDFASPRVYINVRA